MPRRQRAQRRLRCPARGVAALAATALLALSAQAHAATDLVGDVARGEAVYTAGRLADGTPLAASRAGVGALAPAASACVGCHRPSGRGGAEGGVLVPPIIGPVLWARGQPPYQHPQQQRQWMRHQQRSAYDDAHLARALTDGIDPDGQALDAVMPRYHLAPQAMADLLAYLRQLGNTPPAGLHDGTMYLASIFTPGAAPARRVAVRQVMDAWSKGLGFGPVKVRWLPWTLHGSSATWPAQLAAYWRAQPVYALVSGAGGADWAPVDDWCESQRVPCVFPVVDLVPERAARHWSVYLSPGVEGEARMLAQRLLREPAAAVQQWTDGAAGNAAAAALRHMLARSGGPWAVTSRPFVERGADAVTAGTVVLWLSAPHAQRWLQHHAPLPGQRLLLSAQLAPPAQLQVPKAWRPQVQWASLRADPVRQQAGATLSLMQWAQRLGIRLPLDSPDLADAHAGTFFFGDAVAQARGIADGNYLIERLEVAVDRRPAGAAYFRLSLGPGQRMAAQGGHMLAFGPDAAAPRALPVALPEYIRAVD